MKKFAFVVVIVMALTGLAFANGGAETKEMRELPPGPAYASAAQPADSGQVKPIKASDEPIRIAVLGLENNPFWIPVKEGSIKANEELKAFNGTVEWIVPPGDKHTADVFGQTLENAIVQEYDAIATIAGDSGIIPYINKAVAAGIPVATFNVETNDESDRLFFVGADLYRQGQAAGEAMDNFFKEEGVSNPKIGIMTGFFAVEGHELRRLGFEEYLTENGSDIEIVGRVETHDSDAEAYQLAQDYITANPDLDGLYVAAGGNVGAAKAIEDAGLKGKMWVFAYDFVDQTMEYVKKGIIAGTIGQQPFAQGHDPAVRLFNYLVAGEVPEAGRMLTKSDFVTAENMSQFGDW
jgi:ribose transport system substrate-binding protein